MPKDDPLEEYHKKRSLDETPEPSGEENETAGAERPIFVVQKHDATRLHYDFRLEVDGVLKSWAVPKGPSTNPKDKRLAMPTEDHPLIYAGFEGVIPKGHYGAGPVIVWDTGPYRNLRSIPMNQAIDEGKAVVFLEGKKLKGGYALTRFKTGDDESWLLIKKADEWVNPEQDITKTEPRSVLSGLTIEEIARQGG